VKVNASEQYSNAANSYKNYVTYINAVSDDTFGDNAVTVWKMTTGPGHYINNSPVFLVCIEDVFTNRSPSYDSVIQYRKNFTPVTIKTNGADFETFFVIIVAVLLIAVVLLITISRGWKVYVARRRPTNDQQMSSPSRIDAQ
jgi:hypothetical protein